MTIFSAQIRAARALLKLSQAELALESGISIQTIKNYEDNDESIKKGLTATIEKLKNTLENKGVKFVFSKEDGKITEVGVKLKI